MRTLLLLSIATLLAGSAVHAQQAIVPRFLAPPETPLDRPERDYPTYAVGATVAGCQQYYTNVPDGLGNTSGNGIGYSGGITGQIILARELAVSVDVTVGSYPGEGEQEETLPWIRPPFQETETAHINTITEITDYTMVRTDLLLRWRGQVGGGGTSIGVAVGASIGSVLSGSLRQRLQLLKPADATFPDGTRETVNYTGEIPNMKDMRLGLIGGVEFVVPINRKGTVTFSPGLYYNYSTTSISSNYSWKLHTLEARATFLFSL